MAVKVICEICKKECYKKRRSKKSVYRFCSKECSKIDYSMKHSTKKQCMQCNKNIKVANAELKVNNFCSRSCSTTYNNCHKTKGTQVSKIEKYIQAILLTMFPTINFKFNDRPTINAELDILLPDYKLAFELNGIFHYEPIYGKEKLDRTKNNDNRKFQACLEHNIELVVIDISSVSYFKIAKIKKYIDIIISLIINKTSIQPLDFNESVFAENYKYTTEIKDKKNEICFNCLYCKSNFFSHKKNRKFCNTSCAGKYRFINAIPDKEYLIKILSEVNYSE
jgi:hypothetical protein